MSFENKIRLPFHLFRPQFPVTREQFRTADGAVKTISSVVSKQYTGETDLISEQWHQRLVIAMNHDQVFVSSDRYIGEITLDESSYQISWPEFKDYPLGKAAFTVNATPFDAANVNCASCDEISQMTLEDDTFPGPLNFDDNASINVFDNDVICCSPITAEIVSFNTAFIDSASIDAATGIVSLHVKADAPSVTNAQLVVYKVICPNGNYDTATVLGSIDGVTPEACPPPSNLVIDDITSNSATVSWDDENNTVISVALLSSPASPIYTGAATSPINLSSVMSLTPSTNYLVTIYNDCGDGNVSTTVTQGFATLAVVPVSTCGRYDVSYNDFRPPPLPLATAAVTYKACNDAILTIYIPNHNPTPVTICMKQTSAGVPEFFTTNATFGLHYSYVSDC